MSGIDLQVLETFCYPWTVMSNMPQKRHNSATKFHFQQLKWISIVVKVLYTLNHHHHHRILLFFVVPRASMNSFQALPSPAIPLTSFYNLPVLLISSSIVLRHVLFGLPLLLYPWGFQSNVVFSIAPASLHNVSNPIPSHFLLFMRIFIGFCLVILCNSLFVILLVHFIFITRLKHLFINICNIFVVCLVVFLVLWSSVFNFSKNSKALYWSKWRMACCDFQNYLWSPHMISVRDVWCGPYSVYEFLDSICSQLSCVSTNAATVFILTVW